MGKILIFERPKQSSTLNGDLKLKYGDGLESAKAEYYARLRDYLKESCELERFPG